MSAQHAVRAIFGSKDTYEYLPFFYSREFTLSWQFYGVNEGECVLFGSMDEGKFGAYWVKDGKVGRGNSVAGSHYIPGFRVQLCKQSANLQV